MGRGTGAPRRAGRTLLVSLALVVALGVVARHASANGGDLPPQILLQGFVKPEGSRLELLVRVPLVLLASFALPKRGPGYLDLARIDPRLQDAAAATGRQIELFENGRPLSPAQREARLAFPSDPSFRSYASARAHFKEPRLPVETDLYWSQGFLDVALVYPIESARDDFSVRVNVAPELGARIKFHVTFLPVSGPARTLELSPASRRVPFEPRWHQTAWLFVRNGFLAPLTLDRLVFLISLVAPFRGIRGVLVVVLVLTGVQAVSLTASAAGATPDFRLVVPLFEACQAAAVVLLAIENIVAPSPRRRWFVASVVGVLSGFGVGHRLADDWQFAGGHRVVSVASFNVGVALAEVTTAVVALLVLQFVFTHMTGRRLGVVILSVVLGHTAWHRMLDSVHDVEPAARGIASTGSVGPVAWWILLGVFVGAGAWLLPQRFDGHREERRETARETIPTRARP